MTKIIYTKSIEELIDLKIEQRIFGQHNNCIIRFRGKKGFEPKVWKINSLGAETTKREKSFIRKLIKKKGL